VAVASLVASLVLALSTIIAATVMTVGMARASAVDSVIDNEGTLFAIALLLGLLFIGISGITLLPRAAASPPLNTPTIFVNFTRGPRPPAWNLHDRHGPHAQGRRAMSNAVATKIEPDKSVAASDPEFPGLSFAYRSGRPGPSRSRP